MAGNWSPGWTWALRCGTWSVTATAWTWSHLHGSPCAPVEASSPEQPQAAKSKPGS
ncbi:hypothetical protein QJQ45_016963, partial [Haematococcus lacustris]